MGPTDEVSTSSSKEARRRNREETRETVADTIVSMPIVTPAASQNAGKITVAIVLPDHPGYLYNFPVSVNAAHR